MCPILRTQSTMTLLKETMSRILLMVCLFSFCSGQQSYGAGKTSLEDTQRDICNHRPLNVGGMAMRWPHLTLDKTNDDSKLRYELYIRSNAGSLIDYPPGVGRCGGKYPIWQKDNTNQVQIEDDDVIDVHATVENMLPHVELKNDSAVVCVQNENNTCFEEFEVKHQDCGQYSMYALKTEVKGSVFCVQLNFCMANRAVCENGGTCINERDGVSCQCPDGFSGPTCEGDPCSISRPLPRLDERMPSNTVTSLSDSILSAGWYSVPKEVEILSHFPPIPSCGTTMPQWRIECRTGPLDVLVIEDVSSSVMNSDYKKMKDFILDNIRYLRIRPTDNNVAFLSFASTAKVGFHLNTHSNTMDVVEAIASANGEGGGSLVSSALELSVSDVFTYHNGDRAEADNIVLLFTDGLFKDETSLEQDIETLKGRAEVYVVTVGPVVSNSTLVEMATTLDHILRLGDPSTATVITSALHPEPTCGGEQETVYKER